MTVTFDHGWVIVAFAATIICSFLSTGFSEDKKIAVPFSLYLDIDTEKIKVGDPVLIRVRLKNETASEIRMNGGVAGFSSGDLGIEMRMSGKGEWKPFTFSHVWIEPGARVNDKMVAVPVGSERVFLEIMAFKQEVPNDPPRSKDVRAFPEPGEYEIRAVAHIADEYELLRSPQTKIRVEKRSETEMAVIDVAEELIRAVAPINIRRIPDEGVRQGDRLRKYVAGSALAWHLDWKIDWGEWMANDDRIRGPAALKRLKASRETEKGVRRDVLTLALFHGYLNREELDASKSELKLLPVGLAGRSDLEYKVSLLQKKLRRDNEKIEVPGP